jgi:hypothetical protein
VIEPTAEMIQAFSRVFFTNPLGEDVRAGLAAALAIVERDYRIEPKPPWEREGAICPVHHTQLRWGQCVECGVDEDDS